MVGVSLDSAYDTIWMLTGEPPRRFVVGPLSLVIEAEAGEVVVAEESWRAAVEEMLHLYYGFRQPPSVVERFMRRKGWRFRDVPVDTSRLAPRG